jgi:hypothetical protein
MSVRARFALSPLLLLAVTAPGLAYTPESGVWWNPEEPGTGLQIEIQDNFMALSGYVFDSAGAPLWVTAQGFLDAERWNFVSTEDASDGSWLNTFQGGQCIGCEYPGPSTAQLGSQGPVRVAFDPADPTKGVLVWGERSIPIERFHFYLTRPGDGASVHTTKMLGEWNVLLDLTRLSVPDSTRFDGEVLLIEQFDAAEPPARSSYSGCRPDDALVTGCSVQARQEHDLVGSFDTDTFRHIIIVTDSRDAEGAPVNCVLYDVRVDTNMFEGGLDGDSDSLNDGGVIPYPCGAGNVFAFPAYPVRGFRSASRSELETIAVAKQRAASSTFAPLEPSLSADVTPLQRRQALVRVLEAKLGVR